MAGAILFDCPCITPVGTPHLINHLLSSPWVEASGCHLDLAISYDDCVVSPLLLTCTIVITKLSARTAPAASRGLQNTSTTNLVNDADALLTYT